MMKVGALLSSDPQRFLFKGMFLEYPKPPRLSTKSFNLNPWLTINKQWHPHKNNYKPKNKIIEYKTDLAIPMLQFKV